MIKAVKKLKLWSRRKRKRKTHPPPPPYERKTYPPPPPYDPPPPPPPPPRHQCHCCSSYTASSSSTTQPSAPPLPPWMEYTEHTHEIDNLLAPELQRPAPELAYHPLPVPSKQEGTAPALNSTSTYQQYMVPVPDPDPVYGVPVAQAPTAARPRSAGFFGSVVDYLFGCFFPCFRIREVIK